MQKEKQLYVIGGTGIGVMMLVWSTETPRSKASESDRLRQVCVPCHATPALNDKRLSIRIQQQRVTPMLLPISPNCVSI